MFRRKFLKAYPRYVRIEDIVNRNVLSLYNRVFEVESPARRLMQHLLFRSIVYGVAVPGTLLDRVGRYLLITDHFTKPYIHKHV